jgi:hypothetical protein
MISSIEVGRIYHLFFSEYYDHEKFFVCVSKTVNECAFVAIHSVKPNYQDVAPHLKIYDILLYKEDYKFATHKCYIKTDILIEKKEHEIIQQINQCNDIRYRVKDMLSLYHFKLLRQKIKDSSIVNKIKKKYHLK